MNKQHVPDDQPGPATEVGNKADRAKPRDPAPERSIVPNPDSDTEGQGGKVFSVDQSDAEPG